MRKPTPLLAALLLSLLACGRGGGTEAPAPSTASAPPAPSASAAAGPASAAPAAPAAPPAALAPCKALAKQKLVGLGTGPGEFGGFSVSAGSVYLVTFEQPRALATLKRIGRDGEGAQVLGQSKSPGRVNGLRVDDEGAYFVHGKALVKIPLAGGAAATLHEGVIRPIALAEQSVWFVRCNSGDKRDELVSLPRGGGEPKVQASWPRSGAGKGCQYGEIAVTPDDFFLDDWTSRRVFAVARKDGTLRELASQTPFPGRIAVEANDVVFQASGGLYRVPKAGGEAKKISDWGSTPFHYLAWDGSQFFVFNAEAYGMRHTLLQLPLGGGRGKEIEWFAVKDVVYGSGALDIAVDDSCVYLAKNADNYVEVLARPKPAP